MLTDKAKQDFTDWLNPHPDDREKIWGLPGHQINTLIVNWLDSVGLHIFVEPEFYMASKKVKFSAYVDGFDMSRVELDDYYELRHEAISSAINHANYLYNKR